MSGEFTSPSLWIARSRPARALRAAAWIGFVAPIPVNAILTALQPHPLPDPGIDRAIGLVASLPLVAAVAALGSALLWSGRPRPATIRVGEDAFTIESAGRSRSVAFADVESGTALPIGVSHEVQLRLRGGEVLFVKLPERDCERLLDALRLDPKRRVLDVSLGTRRASPRGGFIYLTLLGWLSAILLTTVLFDARGGPLRSFETPVVMFALAAVTGAAIAATSATRVIVGTDGLHIRTPFSTRYVRFDDLAVVRSDPDGQRVVLERRDGGQVALVAPSTEARVMLLTRIGAAVKVAGSAQAEAFAVSTLAREGRSVREWIEALGKLASGSAYRAHAVDADAMQRVLENAHAAPDVRIGAAVALASTNEAGRVRVRVAADACANDSLRDAFRRAAEGTLDDDAVDRATVAQQKLAAGV